MCEGVGGLGVGGCEGLVAAGFMGGCWGADEAGFVSAHGCDVAGGEVEVCFDAVEEVDGGGAGDGFVEGDVDVAAAGGGDVLDGFDACVGEGGGEFVRVVGDVLGGVVFFGVEVEDDAAGFPFAGGGVLCVYAGGCGCGGELGGCGGFGVFGVGLSAVGADADESGAGDFGSDGFPDVLEVAFVRGCTYTCR